MEKQHFIFPSQRLIAVVTSGLKNQPSKTRPVTGRLLRICRYFTQKGFDILVEKELSKTGNLIENSYIVWHLVLPVS